MLTDGKVNRPAILGDLYKFRYIATIPRLFIIDYQQLMSEMPDGFDELTLKLNRETGKIPWRDLQKFFAQGRAIWVAEGQDLIEAARWVVEDNSEQVRNLMDSGKLGNVSDQMAREWLDHDETVWAVVSAPWVLVQRVLPRD